MIAGKDFLNQFKAASWRAPDEVEAFIAAAEAPQTAELLKMLDIVSGKAPDAAVHRTRLTVFARLIDKNPDKTLFAPFVKALKSAEPSLRTTLAALLPKVNSANRARRSGRVPPRDGHGIARDSGAGAAATGR